ncbi:MAG: histidine phosphatase family protein [Sandaracinaceae bacterium]|nr:histidine phosphatase family protein [Sandaracinaceae bacterium]
MWVLLVRHGEAVDYGEAGDDDSRWLTAHGRDESEAVARALGTRHKVDRVFVSPYVRAVQTAELTIAGIGYSGPSRVLQCLTPDGSPDDVLRALEGVDDNERVMLVGHEPSMHRIAQALVRTQSFPPFEKSAICSFQWTRGSAAKFEWRLNPRSLAFETK